MRTVQFDDPLNIAGAALRFTAFDDEDGAIGPGTEPWLTPGEAAYAGALATVRRRAAWRAGRLAAKSAIAALGVGLAPSELEVLPAAGGEPVVRGGPDVEGIGVSISHSGGLAAAVAFERRRTGAVAVDIEVVDQEIDGTLLDFAFDADEARAITAVGDPIDRRRRILRFWTAKEAALKAVGRGLRLPLAAVRVAGDDPDGPLRARVQCASNLAVFFDVQWMALPGYVVAVAREAADAR